MTHHRDVTAGPRGFRILLANLLLTCPLLSLNVHAQQDPSPTGGDASGFEPMFTDEALSGWTRTNTPEETWTFSDGVLYCTGRPIGEIRTEKMYQNFIMELEWRHMKPRGNAGVFVWADDITARGVPFHRGIEVQVLENDYGNNRSHTTHGDIFPIHGATMTPINGRGGKRAFPTEFRSNPSPEWNHYRIECRDGDISLAVNGKVVTRGTDCVPRKGYICLESEGGIVEYRNVRIRELPGGPLPENQVAIADRGYESLYSGLDLRGWTASDESNWQVDDWVLAHSGPNDKASELKTDQSYRGASFIVDVRLKDEKSGLIIDAGDDRTVDLSDAAVADALEPVGRWNRIEILDREGELKLRVNGQAIGDVVGSSSGAAPLVLRPRGGVDFANLYVSAP